MQTDLIPPDPGRTLLGRALLASQASARPREALERLLSVLVEEGRWSAAHIFSLELATMEGRSSGLFAITPGYNADALRSETAKQSLPELSSNPLQAWDPYGRRHKLLQGLAITDYQTIPLGPAARCVGVLELLGAENSKPVRLDEDNQRFIAVMASILLEHDRTARSLEDLSKTTAELSQTEYRYRQILDAITDLTLVKGPKSSIVWANKAFLNYYGMTNEQLHTMIDAPFVEPDYTQQYIRDDAHVFESGNVLEVQEPVVRFDGEKRMFHTVKSPIRNAAGEVVLTVGVSRDITERLRIDKAFEKERNFSLGIIQETPALIIGSTPDGTTTFVNRSMEKASGYSAQEIVGKNWWTLLYPGEEYKQVERLLETFKSGNVVDYEMTMVTRSGEKRTISWNSINRFDDKGKITELIGFGNDVTERRRLEAIVRQSEKMSAVGQLAAGVAHEINNPLGVILGFAQACLHKVSAGDILEMPLKSIEREALRCKSLVQNLLTFSRVTKGGNEGVEINGEVEGALSLVSARARITGVEVIKKLSADLPRITANANQLQQIIVNLATNALDAMEGKGVLTVRTERVKKDGKLWVALCVSDTGTGIPKDILPRIFEPFFTTKPIGKGTGLGLGLVHEIAHQHGAIIDVNSSPGFTEFTVRFPTPS